MKLKERRERTWAFPWDVNFMSGRKLFVLLQEMPQFEKEKFRS